jgi:hypothetical protein
VRTLAEISQLARSNGLSAPSVRRMPANNVMLRFELA